MDHNNCPVSLRPGSHPPHTPVPHAIYLSNISQAPCQVDPIITDPIP